jgi:tetratricopeptide (TPR) repeat protein
MLILLSMILFTQAHSQTQNPNPGPRSKAEPTLLYREATSAFQKGDFEIACKDYERLIERYPSHTNAFNAYPKLISIYSNVQHDSLKTINTIRKYLLLKPAPTQVIEMKTVLAQAYLERNQLIESKATAEEVIKSNDASPLMKATALSSKTEALIRQKKFSDARASLDALEVLATKSKLGDSFTARLPGLELTLKTSECAASSLKRKKKYTDDDFLDYFSGKDRCLKAALPPSLNTEDQASLHAWCVAHRNLGAQLEKQRMDSFLKKKISTELFTTETFAKSLNPELVHCP